MKINIDWNGRQAGDAAHDGAADGLRLAAEHLLGESTQQVPIETGALQNSGTASVDESNLRAAVSYDTPYAVKQHEEMSYQHKNGRNAKYLERPMNTESSTIQKLIARAVEKKLS